MNIPMDVFYVILSFMEMDRGILTVSKKFLEIAQNVSWINVNGKHVKYAVYVVASAFGVKFKSATKHHISSHTAKYIPRAIKHITTLQSLALSFSCIKYIPREILHIKNLRYLTLSYLNICLFPETLKDIKLTTLNLSHNNIQTFPAHDYTIEKLLISHNKLHNINYFGKNITYLDVSYNKISELKNINNVSYLIANNNNIQQLPEHPLLNCRRLFLVSNNITEIPDWIEHTIFGIQDFSYFPEYDFDDNPIISCPPYIDLTFKRIMLSGYTEKHMAKYNLNYQNIHTLVIKSDMYEFPQLPMNIECFHFNGHVYGDIKIKNQKTIKECHITVKSMKDILFIDCPKLTYFGFSGSCFKLCIDECPLFILKNYGFIHKISHHGEISSYSTLFYDVDKIRSYTYPPTTILLNCIRKIYTNNYIKLNLRERGYQFCNIIDPNMSHIYKHIITLSLSNSDMKELYNNVSLCVNLEILDISYNPIKEINCKLPKLKKLHIRGTYITHINKNLFSENCIILNSHPLKIT